MKIKVCGMKYADNISQVAALPVDFMGFIFYPKSARYVGDMDPELLAELRNTKKVGVFVNEQPEQIVDLIEKYQLDLIQLHGDESAEFCASFAAHSVQVIKAFGIDAEFDWSQLVEYEAGVDYFLFDTKSKNYGGTGQVFDWDLLAAYPLEKPYFLSGGLDPQNIPIALQQADNRCMALDLNSKFESAPALKNIELLEKTLKISRNE